MQVRYQAALRPEPLPHLACSKPHIITEKPGTGQTQNQQAQETGRLLLIYVQQIQKFA